jgi:hypothetical protein
MMYRTIIAWISVCLCLISWPSWAVEYRLQVTNLDRPIFSSYLERSTGTPRGQEIMPRLEARLDRLEFPPTAVLPGRELRLLEDPNYGGSIPHRLSFLPATGQQSWTTVVWEANPGERVAFVIRSEMAAWQEVWDIATNGTGVLRRLTIGGPSLFGGQSREVPTVSQNFLANAADRGTFVTWLQQHAKPIGGMDLVVGRRNEIFTTTDRVYMLLTLPPEPHTFKVVVSWKDYDDRGTGEHKFERLMWRP